MTEPTRRSSPTPVASASVAPTPGEAALQAFLQHLNVSLSRRKTYGGLHPMVVRTEEEAIAALDIVLHTRSSFTIGVTKHELLLNGQPFTGSTGISREIARRFHRRGIGALTFHAGVGLEGVQSLLAFLALDPAKTPDDDAAMEPPTISGIIIGRMAYDALMLGDADRTADATLVSLWQSLAAIAADGTGRQYGFGTSRSSDMTAAIGDDDGAFDVMLREESQVADIAASLQALVSQPEFARRTAVALMHLASQGAQAPPELRSRIGQRLHAVIERLGDSSFAPIIRGLGQRAEQQEFVLQVVDVLPVLAVSNWLQIAARASEQELSHHLLRLMTKLSQHSSAKRDGLTDANFRSAAKELVEGWVLADPNPEEHVRLLDRIALVNENTVSQLGKSLSDDGATFTEATRVVQMALELDVVGDDAIAAAEQVAENGGLPEMISWLDAMGPTAASQVLRVRMTSPDAIRKLLLADPLDEAAVKMLLRSIDVGMLDTLLEALKNAKSRDAREMIMTRLRSFGDAIRPVLMAQLDGADWFFARNLLGLLHDMIVAQKGNADVGSMMKYVDHTNPQVRVEAVRMLLDVDVVREAVIRRGLLDADERVVEAVLMYVNQFLHAPQEGKRRNLSVGVAGHLMRFTDAGMHSDALLVIAMRAAAATGYAAARDWLLARVVKRTKILRRPTLVKPTLLNATALSALQRHFANDPVVSDALQLGRTVKGDANWRVPTPFLGSPVIR
jgi:hypothetical protein